MSGRHVVIALAGLVAAMASCIATAQGAATPSRGELLYDTHCKACHREQVHWRDQKLATDWTSLREQVRHWQASARLGWSEADIVEVTRHLNDAHYRFPRVADQRAGLGGSRLQRGGA
jgi:mono/diheme cytochrome c family protein